MKKTNTTSGWAFAAIFSAPLVAAVAVITFSPNYAQRPASVVRQSPIGGDFLQEWIGGQIVVQGQTARLYDPQFTQALQHDPVLLGFRWTEREYYPMVYPPFYYRLVSPLSHLSLSSAARIWCLLNALSFSVGLTWLACRLRDSLRGGVWLIAASGLFHPLLLSLNMGQKSGFLLLLLVATYDLARQGRSFWGGVAFGCIVFKPHLAVVIGPAMLFNRQVSFVLGAMIPLGMAAASSLLMGVDVCGDFLEVCRGAGHYSTQPGYSLVDAQNILGASQFALGDWSLALSRGLAVAAAAAAIGLLWLVIRRGMDVRSKHFGLQFSALIVGTILLSPHFLTYDLSILLIPMLLVAASLMSDAESTESVDSQPSLARAPWQWGLIGIFFCAIGICRPLAEATGVPISVAMLGGWLALLARETIVVLPVTKPNQTAKSSGLWTRKANAASVAPANGPAK